MHVEGVVGVIFNLSTHEKVETRNDSHAFPICARIIEKRLGYKGYEGWRREVFRFSRGGIIFDSMFLN